jgi:hypothetical protein
LRKSLSSVVLVAVLGIALTGCGGDAGGHDQGAEDFAYIADASAATPGGGQETPTDSPSVTAMEEDRFWRIIDQTGASVDGGAQDQSASLQTTLARLPAQEIAEFDVSFAAHRDELYS